MLISGQALSNQPILSGFGSNCIGAVRQLVVDLQQHVLVGLLLEDRWSPQASIVPFEAVMMIAEDGVYVRDDPLVLRPLVRDWIERLMATANPLRNLSLYVPGGIELGKLMDVVVDSETGDVVRYLVGREELSGEPLSVRSHQLKGLLPSYESGVSSEQVLVEQLNNLLMRW